MSKTIYFYCGAHKTASSMIRGYLSKNEAEILQRHGIRSYDRQFIVTQTFFDVVRKYSSGKAVSVDEISQGVATFQNLINEGVDKYLFHNEDFFSALFFKNSEKIATYLARLAGENQKTMILYVRSQADYLESWYMQKIHTGQFIDFKKFVEGVNLAEISWYRIVEGIKDAFDGDLIVRPYESIKEGSQKYLADFLEILAKGEWPLENFDLSSNNRSFSAVAYEIAKVAQPLMTNEEWMPFRRYLQNNFSTRTHERMQLFTSDEKHQLMSSYTDSNVALFKKYMPEFNPVKLGYAVNLETIANGER